LIFAERRSCGQSKIQSAGTFTLGSFGESDGALIGIHQVAMIVYEPSRTVSDGRPDFTVASPEITPPVPLKYMAPGTSGLTFEVRPGRNQAEFALKSL
jgi:hypothetical protein